MSNLLKILYTYKNSMIKMIVTKAGKHNRKKPRKNRICGLRAPPPPLITNECILHISGRECCVSI